MTRATPPFRDRVTLVRFLRSHPELTLAQALELAPLRVLESVPVGDLWTSIDLERLERAKRLTGAEFDRCVLAVIREAHGPVSAGYLRARVAGPRWKLQSAVGRLANARKIERVGTTSATRYWSRSRGKR